MKRPWWCESESVVVEWEAGTGTGSVVEGEEEASFYYRK